MAMQMGGGYGEPIMEINTTPLIDVMLVLLIMLIITLPVLTHAVKLDLPYHPQPPDASVTQPIDVAIQSDGAIIYNGSLVAWPDLEARFRAEARRDAQPELQVRPDRRADYDTVAKILAIAQRTGLQHIGLVYGADFVAGAER